MGIADTVRRSFVAGLILLAPLVVTGYVLRTLAVWTLTLVDPVVAETRLTAYTANIELVAQATAGLLILVTVVGLGAVARWSVGRRVFGRIGRVVNLIPLVNVVYGSVRQVANALVERETAYDRAVLVEHPREGQYVIGFVTGDSPPAVEQVTGEPALNVYLPNSPNPTGGRLAVLPASQVHEIDLSVRRALRLVVTTGIGAEDEAGLPADRAGA
ncbi:MAG: DUF502 domain-containing protein [Halobacteriales archaeon]|nr:DUF502 domain-containing protein [Halobacteriales archaeon]